MNNQAKLFKIENYFETFDRDCVLRAKEVFDDYFDKGIIEKPVEQSQLLAEE